MSNTKKKTGGKRRTSAAKTSGKKTTAGKKREKAEKKAFLLREAGFILFIFAAAFLFISNFGLLGGAGAAVSGFQKGLFGYAAYVFPVLIVILACCFSKKEKSFLFWFKVFAGLLLFTCICAMLHLAMGSNAGLSFAGYYTAGKNGELKNMAAGGAVGGVMGDLLRNSMASFGAWFLLVMLTLLCLVLISEKSIVNYLRRRAEKASELAQSGTAYAKEKLREQKIRREARREAGELRRKEEAMDRVLAQERAMSYPGDPDDIRLSEKIKENREEENRQQENREEENREAGTVSGPQERDIPDYDKDEVPFTETGDGIYKAYGRLLSGERIDAVSAEQLGFAVSRKNEPYTGYVPADAGIPAGGKDAPEENITAETGGIDAFTEIDPVDISEFLDDSYKAVHEKDLLHRPLDPDEVVYPGAAATDGTEMADAPEKHTETAAPAPSAGYDDIYGITDENRDRIYDERKRAAAKDTSARPFTMSPDTEPSSDMSEKAGRNGAAQPAAQAPRPVRKRPYQFPPVSLLKKGVRSAGGNQSETRENAGKLERVLAEFGVGVHVTNVVKGPRVTRYEMTPDMGVKVSRITTLKEDLMLALAASDLRIEAPIPGKSAVGIEVPNNESATVTFRDILEADEFKKSGSRLSWGVGLDIQGSPIVGDISKMPHVLISGTTGSGKSVGINSIIMSVIYRAKPEEVRMILIDPKVVELSVYDGIPHLLSPVVTKPDKALAVLNKACAEMQLRYRLFKESNTRNIIGYNEKVEEVARSLPEGSVKPEKLPYILIIIDELSELMMHAKRDVESAIVSLAQLARAAGIHLVVATQRPSVDVVTGLIKANIPSRVAYKLPSGTDSRTIIDSVGAETLLGNGDMLYKPGNFNNPLRIQGAYLSDGEVEEVVDWLKKHNSSGYEDDWENVKAAEAAESSQGEGAGETDDGHDPYFFEAGILITEKKKASIGLLQRKFKIGFNRASRIMDELNEAGVVSDSEGTKERQILMSAVEFRERFSNG